MRNLSTIPVPTRMLLLLVFLAGPGQGMLQAQSGFREGYIIKNNGDTLTGLVYYTLNSRLKSHCRYKRFEIAPSITYRPGEISSYGFTGGRKFESGTRTGRKRFNEILPGTNPSMPAVHIWNDMSVTRSAPLWKLGITTGYQFSRIQIPGAEQSRYFKEAAYDRSGQPAAGIMLSRLLSRRSERASADLSLLYTAGNYYGFAEYATLADCRDEIFIHYSGVHVPVALRFNLTGGKMIPFIRAGVYGTFMLHADYERFSERQFGNEIFMDWYRDFKPKNTFGYFGSLGAQIRAGQVRYVTLEVLAMQGAQSLYYKQAVYSEPLSTRIRSSILAIMLSVNL